MSLPQCRHIAVVKKKKVIIRKTRCPGIAEPSGYCFRHEKSAADNFLVADSVIRNSDEGTKDG